MSKRALLLTLSFLALLGGGCTSSSPQAEQPATPPAGEQPATPPPAESAPPPQAAAPATVRQSPPPGLTESTDPDRQRKSFAKGRPDPFKLISIIPEKAETEASVTPLPSPPAPVLVRPPSSPAQRSGRSSAQNPSTSTPSLRPPLSNPTVPTLKEPLPLFFGPPPLEATLAKQVVITGLVEVGDSPQIILKAPGEPTTRYVQPGQFISGGQVLVKRIDNRLGETPAVVLEENGIEVVRPVGAPAETRQGYTRG
ncbi:MAG: hypothetical protein HC890_20240 [Chloroflexaceae bacterium]|nr:hypothetical protein [Chloroflexaceae bacterium]